ncbi:uncharacterized protein LOC132053693 [Lycium ferocissimum]|uniref:uncharacterized protein LOC132053693 n=1 Tax=Lycium ferocissimum TaxID=112874 RepID=UPI002815486A|nr:uncharacterized protein LOC132053693 [Lycium ferocissimum]
MDLVTQSVANNAANGCFMNKSYRQVTNILDRLTTHNQAWHSSNADIVPYGSAMIQIMVKENLDTQQTLAELATNISLLTKKFDETQIKKVNVCEDDPGGYQRQNYQGGYQNQNQWRLQQGQGAYNNNNSGNYNNNYGGGNQGSYNNNNNFGNKSSNPYIPAKGQSTEQGSSRVEAMLKKVLVNQSKSERTLCGLRRVGSHTTAIRSSSHGCGIFLKAKTPSKKGGLPSDTVPNPKNRGGDVDCVFAISTRSGKILQGTDKKVVDFEPIDEEEEVQSETPIIVDENPTDKKVADIPKIMKEADDTSKQTVKGAFHPLTQLCKSKPPFPQRLVKKKEDAKFEKFYDQLKQLSINFPFLEDFKEMLDFAKYLKDLLTKKKTVQHETVSLTDTVSSIISITTIQKKGDPGAFTIPCLGMPRPTTMRLQMADRSIKRPVSVVDDVLVRVGKFMLPADFVILDCAVDGYILIILRRPFLATGRALMDLEKNEIKF